MEKVDQLHMRHGNIEITKIRVQWKDRLRFDEDPYSLYVLPVVWRTNVHQKGKMPRFGTGSRRAAEAVEEKSDRVGIILIG